MRSAGLVLFVDDGSVATVLHGSTSVAGYPASHGRARVSTAATDMVWPRGLMPVGGTVVVR